MKQLKSILLLALVFLAGLTAGVVGTRVMVRHLVQQALTHPERTQSLMERNLARRLRLDNDMADAGGHLTDLRKEFQPQAAEVFHDTDQKITALLTPEQQARYDKFKERNWPALRTLRGNVAPP